MQECELDDSIDRIRNLDKQKNYPNSNLKPEIVLFNHTI